MITRSKANYSSLKINDIINLQSTIGTVRRKKTRTKNDLNGGVGNGGVSNGGNGGNIGNPIGNVLLFDIESYKLKFKDTERWVPQEIAWGVYEYEETSKQYKLLIKNNYYVSEIWVSPIYRNQLVKKYKNSFIKHINNVQKKQYPMKTASGIISKMLDTIKMFDVKTIASFNINYDFSCLKNMSICFPNSENIEKTEFDSKYTNPFRIQHLQYLDIMHNAGILYIDYLIKEGFKDEKIYQNPETNRIKLKGRDNTSGIYSAEYIAHKFFQQQQPHTADEDVELEIKIINKMVSEYGINSIELNVMYSTGLYDLFANKIKTEYSDLLKIQKNLQNANQPQQTPSDCKINN